MDHGESSYRRYLAGDNEGLHEIVCAYRTGLLLYLNSLVQNIHIAEELTEDTFFVLMTKRPDFSGKSTFKTWLYAIGCHIAIKHIRKQARQSIVTLESQEYLSDTTDVESSYIRSEQKRQVHQALHRLKPDYRQVLYLSYLEGFSNAEIARIMRRSDKQIRDLLYHAKQALKKELERSGFTYEE